VKKDVLATHPSPRGHWVGDGFPVRSMFTYDGVGRQLSPFLMLDHAGPMEFPPAPRPRGVGSHPHRGFETVTIVYQGEVSHRDSAGNHGQIGPGDVQWMTAAAGVLHDEFHSEEFTRRGGMLEMVQLWVNLPAKFKMSAPRYQEITAASIPAIDLPDDAGQVRVIAGEFEGRRGPAATFTPLNVWDVRLRAGGKALLRVPNGHNAAIAVLRGELRVGDAMAAGVGELIVLARAGDEVALDAASEATILVLSGEPIEEPIVGYGPFVMNTRGEIETAVGDFQRGRFGSLPGTETRP
jgi:redox-sensitive bicupin YhaK (pirin superfamily)